MKTCGYKKYLGWAFSFSLFSRFLSSLFLLPSPFLCRLEFISNQRASREPQLLITYSFAFLHINDCRVLVRFLPQWFKGTSVLCSLGKSRDVQRQGSKPVQSPSILPDGSWMEQVDEKTGGRVDGRRHMGRVGCGDLGGKKLLGCTG